MTSNMEFTDKTQQSLAEAVQLAKDYANAQGEYHYLFFSHFNSNRGIYSCTRSSCLCASQ
jgi:ATP-dependent Clp protease ATP-binding subunit ClpB